MDCFKACIIDLLPGAFFFEQVLGFGEATKGAGWQSPLQELLTWFRLTFGDAYAKTVFVMSGQ